tara:strand:- start:528 stop:1136 length:609 start_codon:yes stop_codon:yes gene_type:complete
MIISHKYKCIFIRIPKTGSTSIENLFIEFDPDCISSSDEPPYGHYYASQVKNMVSKKIWNEYYKFTIMREPLDWFKSQYSDHMRFTHKNHKYIQILLNKNYKLENPNNNILTKEHIMNLYILLGKWFNGNNQKKYIDEELDFIGKYENLDIIINKLKERFKMNNKKEYHYNKSGSEKLIYDKYAESILKILLKDDIEYYRIL